MTSDRSKQQGHASALRDRRCRFCRSPLTRSVVDLGKSPLANSFLSEADLGQMEPFFPLHLFICGDCMLVQLEALESREKIFTEYLYFSSYSQTWLEHCRKYATTMADRCDLNPSSLVIEIASNDGALLQYFKELGIPVLGVEPAANIAAVAKVRGIPTEIAFFGRDTAKRLAAEHKFADLIVANNVIAHVPDLNDFVAAFKILLKANGTATFEFSHLANLILQRQFDTIYHEHFSYFSLSTIDRIFAHHGLQLFDVDVLSTHGGSLRVHVAHTEAARERTHRVGDMMAAERVAGLDRFDCYREFAQSVVEIKCALLEFLIDAHRSRRLVVGYGAPAKGNTLLNYCGVGPDLIPYTVDRNVHKQGRYLPGVHIPVVAPQRILQSKPDFVLILPWNLSDEITTEMAVIREWGGRFVVAIPSLTILP
jgi:SAM-dependent methyltransferase